MATQPEKGPIDIMREVAAQAAAAPPPVDTPEFGLGTRHLPVSSTDDAPVVTRLRAEPNAGEPTRLTLAEWRELYNELTGPTVRIAELEAEVARLKAELERARS
jgi:hypothetical protein